MRLKCNLTCFQLLDSVFRTKVGNVKERQAVTCHSRLGWHDLLVKTRPLVHAGMEGEAR